MSRGALTDQIKQRSKELLGYEIGIRELRLMPYIQYVMMNEHQIDRIKINDEERQLLEKWEEAGYIGLGLSVTMTKKFWDIICEILYLAYVAFEPD